MANEDKKDFNAMLHDSKDMPKFQLNKIAARWPAKAVAQFYFY